MIKEDLDFNLQKITTLYGDLNNLKQIRQNMLEQMNKLDSSIQMQNAALARSYYSREGLTTAVNQAEFRVFTANVYNSTPNVHTAFLRA
jgi:hypothetical protein